MKNVIDWNKPIRQRNGSPARLLGKLQQDRYPMVVACLDHSSRKEINRAYPPDGKYLASPDEHPWDIVNPPAVPVVFLATRFNGEYEWFRCESNARCFAGDCGIVRKITALGHVETI